MIMKILRFLRSYLPFWKGDKVPGVADQIKRTQQRQEQKARKREMEELVRMVSEGRLHEADERQLETLKLIAEIREGLGEPAPVTAAAGAAEPDPEFLEQVKKVVTDALSGLPASIAAGSPMADPARPKMRHTSMVDLVQPDTEISISHDGDLGEEKTGDDDSADKLEKLRRIKGNK